VHIEKANQRGDFTKRILLKEVIDELEVRSYEL